MIGGFGTAGHAERTDRRLIAQGARELTIVNNNAGNGDTGLAALLAAGRVRKIICSFPRQADSPRLRRAVPRRQDRTGTGAAGQPGRAHPRRRCRHRRLLHAHRLRHRAGQGQGDARDRRPHATCSSTPIHADLALIKAERGDRWGNLTYRKTARNFGPIMATAARTHRGHVHEMVRARRARSRRTSSRRASSCSGRASSARWPAPAASSRGMRSDSMTMQRWTRDQMAARVARDIPDGAVRQPRHRPADAGGQPPAAGPRGHPAQRERHARHGPGAGRRARRTTT